MRAVLRSAAFGVAGIALTLASVGPGFAQDASGTWQFTVELDVGGGTPTFVFVQDGDTLSGTYQGTFGQAELEGTIVGAQIEFWFETQGIKAIYTGTLDGDTMSGTCDYGEVGSGAWDGERGLGRVPSAYLAPPRPIARRHAAI